MKAITAKTIAVKVHKDLLTLMDDAIQIEDSDRSKFIRNAVRDRARRTIGNGGLCTKQGKRETAR